MSKAEHNIQFYSVTKIDNGLVFVAELEDDMNINSNLLDDWNGEVKGNDFIVLSKNSGLHLNYKNLSGCNGGLPILLTRCLANGYIAVLLHEKGSEDGFLVHVTAKKKNVFDGDIEWD